MVPTIVELEHYGELFQYLPSYCVLNVNKMGLPWFEFQCWGILSSKR